ncbi:MAG TPA: hypothetical protein VNX60_12265 [Candidatus Acidoferrum sp.]|nr:hypothetical protein [Candidatus Acidoferrum sp.]
MTDALFYDDLLDATAMQEAVICGARFSYSLMETMMLQRFSG